MSILLPQDWRRQPPGVVQLDRSHPILQGLAQGVIAGPIRNATTAYQYVTRTSTSELTVFGNGERLSGSTGYISAPTKVYGIPWTYIVYGVMRSTASASSIVTAAATPGSNTRDRSLFLNTSGQLSAYVSDTIQRYVASGVALTAGVPFMAAAVADGSTLVVWSDKTKASVATSTLANAANYTGSLVVGYGGGGTDGTGGNIPTLASNATIAYVLKLERAIRDSEWLELVENPWQIFQPIRGIPVAFDTGGGTQTLTPSLYTNNQTFYSPTVTPGAVTLSPSLYTNQQTFYGPTLTATVTVSPSLYTNQQTFYGPTATPGTVTLQPALYINTQSFYTPSVNQTGAVVYPSLFTNTNIFFAAEAINEYPDPSQVEFGVKYGPGGTLVGTLTGGGGSSIIRLRSFTERH